MGSFSETCNDPNKSGSCRLRKLLQRVVLFFNKHCKTGLLVVGGKLVQKTRHVSK